MHVFSPGLDPDMGTQCEDIGSRECDCAGGPVPFMWCPRPKGWRRECERMCSLEAFLGGASSTHGFNDHAASTLWWVLLAPPHT
eukprot:7552120-Alexandrium_andersonii.AAC.1